MSVFAEATNVKFFTEGLWCDEAFSWAMASKGSAVLSLTARDFNPPLYYLVLNVWMAIAGTSEMAMRSLSVLFFALTLFIVWRYMVDVAGVARARAAVYLGLFVVNPMLTYYAVEARMYSMVACLSAASMYAFAARKPRLYVAVTTAALYTHYFVLLLLLAQGATALLTETGEGRRRRITQVALPVALLIPWLTYVAAVRHSWDSTFWIEPPAKRFVVHLVTSVFTGHEPTFASLAPSQAWIFTVILVPVVAWSLVAGWRLLQEPDAAGEPPNSKREVAFQYALLLLWALLPAVLTYGVSFVKAVFLPRYLIFSTVGLLLLMITGLERARLWARLPMLFALFALSIDYQVIHAHRHSKGRYRETISQIAASAGREDVLYVRGQYDFFPAQYYFGEGRVFLSARDYDSIAAFAGKVLIPAEKVREIPAASAGRVFLLISHEEWQQVETPERARGAGRGSIAFPSTGEAARLRIETPPLGSSVSTAH
jgi:uncharacterized membrane protein